MLSAGSITSSNKKVTILNIVLALIYEAVVVVNGLVVHKLILGVFGSEINGLVTSIVQFLNLITLLEGGVGGIIKAALYKPLSSGDQSKLSAVYNAAKSFYRRLAAIYITYGIVLAFAYPFIFKTGFDWYFVSALVAIIAAQTFIQYFFSLTFKVLITADRKGFFVSIVSIMMQLASLGLSILVINLFPNVLLLKGVGVGLFVLQPILYGLYVKKHYKIDKNEPKDPDALKQRWDGFGHNLAYFIHSNTDVVLITVFCSLLDVSVYGVYFMVISALRTLVSSISTSIAPTMGNILAKGTDAEKNEAFDIYSFTTNSISTLCFSCGIVLITPFVMVYTKNITDVDYYHPWLGYLLMLAEYVYCIRGPYVETAYASGHFRQTVMYAYVEAGLNIAVSVVLVQFLGLEGVAIGTLIAMIFRLVMHVIYLKRSILNRPLKKAFIGFFVQIASITITFFATYFLNFKVQNYFEWFLFALITGGFSLLSLTVATLIFDRKTLNLTCRRLFKRTANNEK